MDCDVEILISGVCDRPALWDKTTDVYKDRNETAKCWREVCNLLNEDFESMPVAAQKKYEKDLTTKWKTVRDGYRKALDRVKKARRSGAPNSKIRKYIYNDQLDFLRKIYETRSTEDAIASDNSDDGSGHGSGDCEAEVREHAVDDEVEPPNSEASHQSSITAQVTAIRNKKRAKLTLRSQPDEFEDRILQIIETPNRNISFMQGLLPSLETFNDDEIIEFQVGVLHLIQKIKKARINPARPVY